MEWSDVRHENLDLKYPRAQLGHSKCETLEDDEYAVVAGGCVIYGPREELISQL